MREREGILDARIGKCPSIKVAAAPAAAPLSFSLEEGTDADGRMKYLFTRARALWSFPLPLPRSLAPPPADTLLVYYICA